MNILFDFDGTLINSHTKAIELFNQLADGFKLRKIETSEIETLKNLSSKDLITHLDIPFYKVPSILLQVRKLLKDEMLSLQPISNINDVVKQLHASHYKMGILTSNSLENVHTWLKHHDMEQYFSFVHAESSYFGKGRLIKKLLKKHYIPSSHVWYVGDETRDIEAATSNHISSIAVTWGFTSEKILAQHHPTAIARKPEDLLKIVGNN